MHQQIQNLSDKRRQRRYGNKRGKSELSLKVLCNRFMYVIAVYAAIRLSTTVFFHWSMFNRK
jgi:hypothetical protein